MKCRNCGYEVNDDAKICIKCKSILHEDTNDKQSFIEINLDFTDFEAVPYITEEEYLNYFQDDKEKTNENLHETDYILDIEDDLEKDFTNEDNQALKTTNVILRKRLKYFKISSVATCLLSIILIVYLLINISDKSKGNIIASKKFDSPEAAIERLTHTVSKNNLGGALETFAINEMAEGYDFETASRQSGFVYLPIFYSPAIDDLYIYSNKLVFANVSSNFIKSFCYGFLVEEIFLGEYPIVLEEDDEELIPDLLEKLDVKKLQNLKVVGIFTDNDMLDESMLEYQEQLKLYSADEMVYRNAILSLDGKYYQCGFYFLRYNNYWKLLSIINPVQGMSSYNPVMEVTKDEAEQLLGHEIK